MPILDDNAYDRFTSWYENAVGPTRERQYSAARAHKYPVGALVEWNHGVRLWVVYLARDRDETPLYCLSHDPNDHGPVRTYPSTWVTGVPEESLTFVRMINAPEN